MSRMASLLLLCLLVVSVLSDTTFIFTGKLLCRMPEPFAARIITLEHDSWTESEILHNEYLKGEAAVLYNFTTSADHDGWGDKTFELEFQIIHNCNSQDFFRGKKTFTLDVAEVPVDGGVHDVSVFDIDLTNRGRKIKITTEK